MAFTGLTVTDEDVAGIAPNDWRDMVKQPVLANGRDGVLNSASPWNLVSTLNNFGTQGVAKNHVCWLELSQSGEAASPYAVALLAVESVSGTTATLRALGLAAGIGLAPGVVNATAVRFNVATCEPTIAAAEEDLRRDLRIQSDLELIATSQIKRAICYRVLYRLCLDRARMITDDERDHWTKKWKAWLAAYDAEFAALSGLYGPSPAGRDPIVLEEPEAEDFTEPPYMFTER